MRGADKSTAIILGESTAKSRSTGRLLLTPPSTNTPRGVSSGAKTAGRQQLQYTASLRAKSSIHTVSGSLRIGFICEKLTVFPESRSVAVIKSGTERSFILVSPKRKSKKEYSRFPRKTPKRQLFLKMGQNSADRISPDISQSSSLVPCFFKLEQISISCSGLLPTATSAATIAPALVPETDTGCSLFSERAFKTPICAAARHPPPDNDRENAIISPLIKIMVKSKR